MPERISKGSHKYAGRRIEDGEPFEVKARDVKVLLLLGRIVPEKGEKGYVERPYMVAEPDSEVEAKIMTPEPLATLETTMMQTDPEQDAPPVAQEEVKPTTPEVRQKRQYKRKVV